MIINLLSEPQTAHTGSLVIVSSVHDYRMKRRGSIQTIADALSRLGYDVTFISVRFSLISLLKGDSRQHLLSRVNAPEMVAGIRCYLWFTLLHPFETNFRFLNYFLEPLFSLYARLPNKFLDETVRSASVVIVESGLGIALAPRIRKLNPSARQIYRASDLLETIGAPSILQTRLEQSTELFDSYCLIARKMASDFAWANQKSFYVPLGINRDDYADVGTSPYQSEINAVSVGSMLFDEKFFVTAATNFPNIQFHVIGCGTKFQAPRNVHLYDEMSFRDTLPFIKHATFGVAAYKNVNHSEYLSESSLKLMQYEYFGIPAVCPNYTVGDVQSRVGYEPGDSDSIANAIQTVLTSERFRTFRKLPTWDDLAQRLLAPENFPDTDLSFNGAPLCEKYDKVASLIVSTLGRKNELVRLLESLERQQQKNFEVIIVDQNPPGYLDEIIKTFESRLAIERIQSPKGLSIGRNHGLQHARGVLVCFPDDDCWYLPSTLRNVIKVFERCPGVDILMGRTVDATGADSLSPSRHNSGTVTKQNLWMSGNSNTIFLRRDAAQRIGPFNESLGVGATTPFQSGEETDYVLRGLAKRLKAVYLQGLLIHHDQVDQAIGDKQIQRAWKYSMGFGRVLRVHDYGAFYVGYRVLRSAFRAFISLISFDFPQARYKLNWAAGTLVGFLWKRPPNSMDR